MSRVHDALRRAEQSGLFSGATPRPDTRSTSQKGGGPNLAGLLDEVQEIPFQPQSEALLIDVTRPTEAPMEEFRTLRTRLNHLKNLQPIHSVVVTSPSPAEGKSFTAANLAIAEAHLSGNTTLLADFDFRRPSLHTLFGIDRSPGITDYLQGKAELNEVIKRIAGTNLYIMPAGEAVLNPPELLNLRDVKVLLDRLPGLFNWIILDTPPLLFAADASLLSTMCHGTLLVVRIGSTTIDSITRAMQSLCNNNVLGVVANSVRQQELYSKYTYYNGYDEDDAPAPRASYAAASKAKASKSTSKSTKSSRGGGLFSKLTSSKPKKSKLVSSEIEYVGDDEDDD